MDLFGNSQCRLPFRLPKRAWCLDKLNDGCYRCHRRNNDSRNVLIHLIGRNNHARTRLFYFMPDSRIKIDQTDSVLFYYQTHSKFTLSILSGSNSLSALASDILAKASRQPLPGLSFHTFDYKLVIMDSHFHFAIITGLC